MKNIFKQFIQTWTVILVAGIVVYASPAAKRPCCLAFSGTCLQGSHAIGDFKGTSPACRHGCKRQRIPACETFSVNAGAENTCCRTEHCDRSNQAIYFSLSFPQDVYPLQTTVGISHVSAQAQKTIATDSLSASPKAVAIYLLTQSFIC